MPRVLNLSLILYLPLLLALLMEFASGLTPDRFGSLAFIVFFGAWVVDGSACFVASLAVGTRAARGLYAGRERVLRALESACGFLLGLPAFLILDELARKLYLFLKGPFW